MMETARNELLFCHVIRVKKCICIWFPLHTCLGNYVAFPLLRSTSLYILASYQRLESSSGRTLMMISNPLSNAELLSSPLFILHIVVCRFSTRVLAHLLLGAGSDPKCCFVFSSSLSTWNSWEQIANFRYSVYFVMAQWKLSRNEGGQHKIMSDSFWFLTVHCCWSKVGFVSLLR